MQYRPEIDGLRGIAVALVITFHAFPQFLGGGWVGVDVFFVISGFLITSLTIKDLESKSFSLREFYIRRVRRLAPALLATLTLTGVLGWLFLPTEKFREIGLSGLSSLTGWSNIYFWRTLDYFAEPAVENPLIHTWSLALEEQFYLIFPVLLLILRGKKRVFLLTVVIIAMLASYVSAAALGLEAQTVFYLLPTRAWELLAGAMLALSPNQFRRLTRTRSPALFLAGLGGVVTIIGSAVLLPEGDYRASYSLLPVAGTLLALHTSSRDTRIQKLLAIYPLRQLGLISYSAYLIHQPLLVLARNASIEGGTVIEISLVILATLVLAGLSYRFIEQPFRSSESTPISTLLAKVSISAVTAAIVMVCVTLPLASERPWQWPQVAIPGFLEGRGSLQKESWTILRGKNAGANHDYSGREGSGWFSATDPRPSLLILGNSISKDLYNTLYHSEEATRGFQLGRMGVQIRDLEDTHELFQSASYRDASVVIVASFLNSDDVENLEAVLNRLKADGKSVAVAIGIPRVTINQPDSWIWIDKLVWRHQERWPDAYEISERVNEDFYQLLQESSESETNLAARQIANKVGAVVLERLEYICEIEKKSCFAVGPGLEKYFYDNHHQTLDGSKFFGSRISEIDWLDGLK